MVNNEIIKLKFDNSFNGRLFAVQGDTGRVFNLQVFDDFSKPVDVTSMKLRMYVANSKEVSYSEGEIVTATEGKIKVQVYNSQLKYPGKQKAQFILTDKDGQKIGSKIFDLWIEEGLEAGPTVGRNVYVDFDKIDEALELIKNYDKTLEDAREVDTSLKVGIKEGIETRNNLADCKKKALEIKSQLDASKLDANKTLDDLKTTKTESETLKSNLTSENQKATENINNLSWKIEVGKTTTSNLNASVEEATSTNTTLKATDTQAKKTEALIKDLMNQLNLTKDEVSKIIVAGDLSKYVTDPKLEEALKSYATKEDLSSIDVTGQLVDYAKKIDLDNKVDKVSGKALSSNDYTNADKAKVDAIPPSPKYTDTVTSINGKTGAITKADITALGIPSTNTTYDLVTQSSNGLMSAADKKRLDNIKEQVALTEAEYNALSTEQQNDATKIYFIKA